MTAAAETPSAWRGLRLGIGGTVVPASDTAAVDAAIAAFNRANVSEGLPDALNPSLIDPAKAHAFLAALVKLPVAQFRKLAGHALDLTGPDLPIRATSPASPASFASLKGLRKPDIQGDIALVGVTMRLDCALATRQAAASRAALEAVNGEITQQQAVRHAAKGEAETKALFDLSVLQRRRSALALAWEDNAAAARGCAPRDAAMQRDLAAARKAVSDYLLP